MTLIYGGRSSVFSFTDTFPGSSSVFEQIEQVRQQLENLERKVATVQKILRGLDGTNEEKQKILEIALELLADQK